MSDWCQLEPEEGTGYPWTRDADCCELVLGMLGTKAVVSRRVESDLTSESSLFAIVSLKNCITCKNKVWTINCISI